VNVALSGASGFIGRHVLNELERRGWPITLLQRSAASAPAQRHRVVHVDLAAPTDDAFERCGRPDVLIHLAWGGLPNYRSLHHFEHELPAQYRFVRQMVAAGLRSLVVAGTCFEYGMRCGALHEELDALPANPYALAKDTLRRQLVYLQGERPFALTWARLFYMYGDGQAPNSLLPQLRSAVARGAPRFPMSGGEQLRDYLPVTEVARCLVDLATTRCDHGIVNVCSGTPVSVRKLVEGWIEQHGWSIEPELGRYPYPEHEPMAFWGDRRKLDRCLVPS
jgi:nucleoside-diphosphate-sugar epimerase